jgi:hypothetical protein
VESLHKKDAETLAHQSEEIGRQKAINAGLQRDKRQENLVKLTETWFPRPNAAGFRCAGTTRAKVTDLLMALSDADEVRNEQLIQLSGNATLAEDKKSKLLDGVMALVNNIPEPDILNLSGHTLSQLDPEADITDEPTRLREETVRLSEKEKIPFTQAAKRIAAQQRKGRR